MDDVISRPISRQSRSVIGLSWKPKLPLLSTTNNETIFLIHNEPKKLNIKLFDKQINQTTGKNWFDMPAQTITQDLKMDIQLLKLRSAIDPKRHYNKGDSKSRTLPQNFQVGTVVESALEYYTGRLTKKERKATLADELLSDGTLCKYRKRKVQEIEAANRPPGVEKWKIYRSGRHTKAGKGEEKRTRL